MKAKPLGLAALMVGLIGAGSTAPLNAATLETNVSGQLVGARNVDVAGILYNVTFVDGSCSEIFGGCSQLSKFAFQTYEAANAAGQALLAQVFLDTPLGLFDSNPFLTFGCSSYGAGESHCNSSIPYALRVGHVEYVHTTNQSYDTQVCGTCGIGVDRISTGSLGIFESTADRLDFNWAVFTSVEPIAAVPLHPSIVSQLTGLGLLGLLAWRRRKVAAAR